MKESKTNPKVENVRFTTLVDPHLLSHLKLISYFTNKKVYEMINSSIQLLVNDFEITHQTKIDDIIKLSTSITKDDDEIIIIDSTKN